MPRWMRIPFALPLLGLSVAVAFAVPPKTEGEKPAANTDAEKARGAVSVPKGMTVELWASEPLMMNPVSFCFDEKGRAYVAETTRFDKGVPDTRGHMYWLDEDIGSRSVADRLKMYEQHKYGAKENNFESYEDHVRMVWDSTGSGKADKSTVFAGGFNKLKDGLAAGVLARKGQVYLTCIPDLYRLKDTKGTGEADVKESLATGFGIRAQFLGHDMHGLRMGPDGRLYFSIGDRGLNVTTKDGKKLQLFDEGAVLRCDQDGSNMEIVHTGLRNPQELAFDDYGNLFTFDNNCDSGDKARWVHIVEGGDSGWRCGYQYGTKMDPPGVPQGNRGPWNAEKIWHLPTADGGPPAYVVPPLAHIGNGPAGITHYPGVGLNAKYKDHFFACDFTSNPGGSKIWDVSVKQKGASFQVVKAEPFVQNMVPTDCEFGPDGAFYFSDWVGGWNPPGKGRIFKVSDPEAMKDPAVAEAKKLLADGFEKKSVEDLAKLLEHPHQLVRLEAQYELAGRKRDVAVKAFVSVAKESKNAVARLHGIWGLGQCKEFDRILAFADDADDDVRVQVGMTLARQSSLPIPHSLEWSASQPVLAKLLSDKNPRVQANAAVAYGKACRDTTREYFHQPSSDVAEFAPLFDLLRTNADKDVYLRQAAVQGLVSMTKSPDDLFNAWTVSVKQDKAKYDTTPVRMGVVLALRRLQSAKLDAFVTDSDPKIAVEAVRAIHDQNITAAMPAVAKLADKPGREDAIAYRALSAHFKLGTPEDAAALAAFAARGTEPDYLRATALKLLAEWGTPSKRDAITGLRQDLADRDANVAADAVRPLLAKVFAGTAVGRKEASDTAKKLGITEAGPLLAATASDEKQSANLRVDSLYALDELKSPELAASLKAAASSSEPKLRGAVRLLQAKARPAETLPALVAVLDDVNAAALEKQLALEALGKMPESKDADEALAGWLDTYLGKGVPDDLKLDVIEAAKARAEKDKLKHFADLKGKLAQIDAAAIAAEAKDHLARCRESLAGGDAEKGRAIFLNGAAVYCQRCHKLDGQGGDVGPVLNGVAKDHTREYLLESVVAPSKQIAKGYESVSLTLLDGRTVSGVLKSKDKAKYVIATAEAKIITVPVADIDSERPDKSAMPEDLVKKLSRRELRDVVEFLASLKEPAPK